MSASPYYPLEDPETTPRRAGRSALFSLGALLCVAALSLRHHLHSPSNTSHAHHAQGGRNGGRPNKLQLRTYSTPALSVHFSAQSSFAPGGLALFAAAASQGESESGFVSQEALEKLVAKPSLLGPFQAFGSGLFKPKAIFFSYISPPLSVSAAAESSEPVRMYGGKLLGGVVEEISETYKAKLRLRGEKIEDPSRLPVLSGDIGDVIKGELLIYSTADKATKQLPAADKVHNCDGSVTGSKRTIINVLRQDGSSVKAYAYFQKLRTESLTKPLSGGAFEDDPGRKENFGTRGFFGGGLKDRNDKRPPAEEKIGLSAFCLSPDSDPPYPSPVVLLHGIDEAKDTFEPLIEELQSRGLISVSMDLRGHGESDMGPWPDFNLKTLASDAVNVARAVGKPPYVFYGHDLGGRVAIKLAATYPQLVRALILEDCDIRPLPLDELTLKIESELPAAMNFTRLFPDYASCKRSLQSFGYESKTVDSYGRANRIVEVTPVFVLENPNLQKSEKPPPNENKTETWSGVHPLAHYLSYTRIMNTDETASAFRQLARELEKIGKEAMEAQVKANASSAPFAGYDGKKKKKFATHAFVPSKSSFLGPKGAPGTLDDMLEILPELKVNRFPDISIPHKSAKKWVADIVEDLARWGEVLTKEM